MEPTESAAPGSRLRLCVRALAWRRRRENGHPQAGSTDQPGAPEHRAAGPATAREPDAPGTAAHTGDPGPPGTDALLAGAREADAGVTDARAVDPGAGDAGAPGPRPGDLGHTEEPGLDIRPAERGVGDARIADGPDVDAPPGTGQDTDAPPAVEHGAEPEDAQTPKDTAHPGNAHGTSPRHPDSGGALAREVNGRPWTGHGLHEPFPDGRGTGAPQLPDGQGVIGRPANGRGPGARGGDSRAASVRRAGQSRTVPGVPGVGEGDAERQTSWPALPTVVVTAAGFVLGAGFLRAFTQGHALFPSGAVGWSLAVLTGIIVGHLVMLGRSRWWGGTGSGAALTLAVLLLYGWVPAGMVSLTVVVLVVIARRGRWRQGVLHGAVDLLGIGAGALVRAAFGCVPSVESPSTPDTWTLYTAPEVVLVAAAYLVVTRTLLWYLHAPRAGLPTVARTALVRQGLVAIALLGIAPLICVVADARPVLLPLFAIPLIALDSTLWIARARAEEQLRDPLTGLPNRQWLQERIWTALDEAERIDARAALMLIDLDRFRSVNDTLGHLAGDRLLLQIADRLRMALPRGAEAARLGGDEFAVLLPVADSTTSATRIARGLVAALSSPLDLDGLTLVLEASAGVAVFPDHALDAEGLLRRSDVAMYQAKRDRTGVEVYESKRDSNTPDRLGLLGDLRRALDAHEVELHYQPKVRFDGHVAGLEALVRWVHPERGKVPPDEFIAIAESSGLMPHLTEYVLETALGQVARWRSQGLFVPVAVNVSPRDVHTPGFAGSVAARLARHGVPAGALQLEITEHVLLEDPQRAADTLNALTGHGVKMSLDDFGTGYSSLVHLRKLPVSELKIDRSFVARLAVDAEDAEIVRCTLDLAHSLGLLVVAEGVEDDETWEHLRDLGCDAVQGWLVAAAMPADETTAWLLARGSRGWQRPAAALPAAASEE